MADNALEACQLEIARLKNENVAFASIMSLLENFLAMAHSAKHEKLFAATMRKTLKVAGDLAGAEKGSLFLFDEKGAVKESLLARVNPSEQERDRLVGMVLDGGLAGWVRRRKKAGIVYDTRIDKRWMRLPDEPFPVRSALAVPVHRGENLFGILTLMHSRANNFNFQDLELIQMTADQIALVLENVELYEKLDESFQRLEHAKRSIERYSRALDRELEKGRRIQRDFLPQRMPEIANWRIHAWFSPAYQVAGDFYDLFYLPDNCVGIVIADVCDKGVGAALFMALFRSLIRVFSGQTDLIGMALGPTAFPCVDLSRLAQSAEDQGAQTSMVRSLKAIDLVNRYIVQNHGRMGMFATIFFGVLDPPRGQITFVNAGHEPIHILDLNGVKTSLMPTGPAVGLSNDSIYTTKTTHLEPGNMLVGYTDGITEARALAGHMFGRDRFYDLIDRRHPSAGDLMKRVKSEVLGFIGSNAQSDDITLIALQRNCEQD